MRGRGATLALLGYLALTLVLFRPLLPLLERAFFGPPSGDVVDVLWHLDWMKTAVFDLKAYPFYSPGLFHPLGLWIAGTAQQGWYYLLMSPLVAALGPVLVYNLAMIIALPFAGLGVWWLVRGLSGDQRAAFVAGSIYMLAPILTIRLYGGHFQYVMGFTLMPWAVMFFYRALRKPVDKAPVYIALSGLLLALTALWQWYFLFLVTLPLVGLVFAFSSPVPLWRRLGRAVIIALIMTIAIAPFIVLSFEGRSKLLPNGGGFSIFNVVYYSVSPDHLLAPNMNHSLAGYWESIWPRVNGEVDSVTLGYGAMGLAAAALLSLPWRRTRPFVVVALIALVLAMGPVLKWQGKVVTFAPPPAVAAWLQETIVPEGGTKEGQFPIPLPGMAFYYFVPFFDSMRVVARFAGMLLWAEAVLAGLGAAALLRRGRGGRAAVAVLFALVLLEGVLLARRPITHIESLAREADAWLAAQPPQTTIIEYPFSLSQATMYRQTLHDRRIVNGYMGFWPELIGDKREELGYWPRPEALPVLREWGVDLLLLNREGYDAVFRRIILPAVNDIDGLCFVDRLGQAALGRGETYVYRVAPAGGACR